MNINATKCNKLMLKDLLEIIDNTISVKEPVMINNNKQYIRIKEEPITITDEMENHLGIVTAHILDDYTVKFFTVKLKEDLNTWLLELIKQDLERKEEIGDAGKRIYS